MSRPDYRLDSEKKKLLLVSANRYANPYPVYPIGLSYLKTYLNKVKPDLYVDIFDFNIDKQEDLSLFLKQNNPDYLGISIRNIDNLNFLDRQNFIHIQKEIIQTARSVCKISPVIIVGGAGYSIYPEKIFEFLRPDYGIKGEGEKSLNLLIEFIENGKDVSDIEGLVYRSNGRIIVNGREKFLTGHDVVYDSRLIEYYWQNCGMLPVQTKRGCPYKCIYCTYPIIEGSRPRSLDSDMIVDSISRLYHDHGINYFFFVDSVFNINNDENIVLAEKIIKSDFKIRWDAYFSPKNVDRELLEIYKKSGLTNVEFGSESFSDRTLDAYRKSFTFSDVKKVSDLCRQLKIYYCHFLIFGGYGETWDTINETLSNAKLIERSVFFPFVGMRIYSGTCLAALVSEKDNSDEKADEIDDISQQKYFIMKDLDFEKLKEKAEATGKRFVFPDEDQTGIMKRMRQKQIKGPLWEYLIR